MALYTRKELHDKTAGQIRTFIEEGYRIDPSKSISKDRNKFKAVLTNNLTHFTVEIETVESSEAFEMFINIFCNMGGGFSNSYNMTYYKVHDDIYSDSKLEAGNERVKWYAECLGVDKNSKNPIQDFADMLGNHITNCFGGGK